MNSNINLDSLIIKEGFTLIAHHGFDINSSISRMNTLLPNWSPYDDGIENICKGVPEHLNNRIFHVDK